MMRMRTWVPVLGLLLTAAAVACSSEGGSRAVVLGETPTSPGGTAPRLTAPSAESPSDDAQLDTLRPTLSVRNGTSDQGGTRTYEFQISDNSDFSTSAASYSRTGVPEGANGTTSFTVDRDLQPTTRLYWRARLTQSGTASAWSSSSKIRTKPVGFIRSGELYDPLTYGESVGSPAGATTFVQGRGIRLDTENSWVRYELPSTMTSGEISVEVEGLRPNGPASKARIFSMMDGGNNLFNSRYLFNVQYRGREGNPDNCFSFKVLYGGEAFKFEPDLAVRSASVYSLDSSQTYLWKATWSSSQFRLEVFEGGIGGNMIYNRAQSTSGSYSPSPHTVYLGANNGPFGQESGSFAGATYRNLWVGSGPRPTSLGNALTQQR